jgi:predicted small secreted protein
MKMNARTLILCAIISLIAATTLVSAGGCNLWHAAGKDVQRAGEKMQ